MHCSIRLTDEVEQELWDQYVLETSGNPTQLVSYSKLMNGNCFPIFVSIEADGRVIFQWLLSVHGKHGFCFLQADSEPTNEDCDCVALAMRTICDKYQPFKFVFYDLAFSRFANKTLLEHEGFSEIYEYQANIVDLRQSEEDIFKGIHSKHRNKIRRAEREGVHFFEGKDIADVERYYTLSQATYQRTRGKNVEKSVFIEAYQALHESGNIRFFFVEHDREVQSAAAIIMSSKRAVYWKGATKSKEITGSSNFLHWEIMKLLKREDVSLYDLSGAPTNYEKDSKIEGVIHFKHRFGGVISKYYGGECVFCSWKSILFDLYKKML